MLRHAELRARVADAERIWSAGDWAGAFERFESLAEEIANSRSDEPVYGFNEALVLHRFADLCVERGHLQQALDTYGRLQDHAEADEDRALAAFKRLDVAVTSGDGLLAREVRRSIAAVIGRELPPGRVHRESLAQWERTCSWGSDARAALFAQMYLALGRMANAQRRLDEAAAFFSRGIDHARASRDAAGSVAEIPLQLALGQTHLTMGDLSACSAALRLRLT